MKQTEDTHRPKANLKLILRLALGLVTLVIALALVYFAPDTPGESSPTTGTPLPHIQATQFAQAVEDGACIAAPNLACDPSKPCGHRVGSSAGAACGDHTCGRRVYNPNACGGVQPCYYCCCGCCPNGCGGGPSPTATRTPTPTPTPTPLPSWSGSVVDDSSAAVGGVPVELRGRYDDCAGATEEQVIDSTLTSASGTYSFVAAMPPNPGCGWQGVSIVETLPWNSVYQPLSASVLPPGWVYSASEIRYTWRTTGSYGGNDFVVELIPVDLALSADYPYLVLRGPELPPPAGPLPAQVLRGRYSGPLPLGGRRIDIYTWDGSVWDTYSVFTNASGDFLLTPAFAGDPLLGTTLLGAWQTYAQVTVPGSGVYVSPDAFWWVHWFPVHQTE